MVAEPATAIVTEDLMARLRAHRITSEDEIYEINGVPSTAIAEKHSTYLTPLVERTSHGRRTS